MKHVETLRTTVGIHAILERSSEDYRPSNRYKYKKKSRTHSRVFIFREVPLLRIHRFGNFPCHLSSKTLPYAHIPPNLFLAATLRNFLSPTHIHLHSRHLHKQIYFLFFLFLFTKNHIVSSQAMACQDSQHIFVKRFGIKVH